MNNDEAIFPSLPTEIIADILSRLHVLQIARVKCVCKSWLEFLSSPEFCKLHLSRSSADLLVSRIQSEDSYLFKIFEFEDELELKYTPVTKFDLNEFIGLFPAATEVVGSVNGLLCLIKCDDVCICNPITREYISFPVPGVVVQYPRVVAYGFGVSATRRQYKVVLIFHERELDDTGTCVRVPMRDCRVYTLGTTGAWRSIVPSPPLDHVGYPYGVFLNGNLHWMVRNLQDSLVITCLDLETEVFETFSGPVPEFHLGDLAVLGGCLSVCDNRSYTEIDVWVMKEYGVRESWTKEFVIKKPSGECYDLVIPVKLFKNGDSLIIWGDFYLFYHSKKTEATSEIHHLIEARCSEIDQAIVHVSSLVSLACFATENVNSF